MFLNKSKRTTSKCLVALLFLTIQSGAQIRTGVDDSGYVFSVDKITKEKIPGKYHSRSSHCQ